MTEAEMNLFQRTKETPTGTSMQNADDMYYFVTADPLTNKIYRTFNECYDAVQQAATDAGEPEPTEEKIEKHDSAVKVIDFFESKYTCSGICEKALFYYTLDISEGIPTKTCLRGVNEEIRMSLAYVGITVVVTGVLMFFIWLAQYCLWRRFK